MHYHYQFGISLKVSQGWQPNLKRELESRDMQTTQRETVVVAPRSKEHEVFCPRCGSIMVETDRIIENGFAYVWYECSVADCMEQWLSKRPAIAG